MAVASVSERAAAAGVGFLRGVANKPHAAPAPGPLLKSRRAGASDVILIRYAQAGQPVIDATAYQGLGYDVAAPEC